MTRWEMLLTWPRDDTAQPNPKKVWCNSISRSIPYLLSFPLQPEYLAGTPTVCWKYRAMCFLVEGSGTDRQGPNKKLDWKSEHVWSGHKQTIDHAVLQSVWGMPGPWTEQKGHGRNTAWLGVNYGFLSTVQSSTRLWLSFMKHNTQGYYSLLILS